MRANRLRWVLLFLFVSAVFQLPAQQSEADRKLLLAEIRAKAEKGDAQAQCKLGLCYYEGAGVAKDAVEAVKWFRRAVEQGVAQAQCNLGLCYHNGEGVTKDYVEAYKWLSLASAQGDEDAKALRRSLAQQMTPAQIARGFRLARDFKPSSAPESGASAPTR